MSLNCGQQWAYSSSPRRYMSMENHGGVTLTGKNRRTRTETCPSATLSTTIPTWIDMGVNECFHGDRQATNRLSDGTAWLAVKLLMHLDVGNTDQVSFSSVNGVAGPNCSALWGEGRDRLDDQVVGSKPAEGMDVCPHLSVLAIPPPVQGVLPNVKTDSHYLKVILIRNRSKDLIRTTQQNYCAI
jgi:hypothetical protein